jgi:tRNA A-37 threonylcarbamoyl transferase component Bud32
MTTMAQLFQTMSMDDSHSMNCTCWFWNGDINAVPVSKVFKSAAAICKEKPEKRAVKDKEADGIQSVQEWATQSFCGGNFNAAYRGQLQTSTCVDGSDTVAYGTRKPDIVHYLQGQANNWFYITAIGDNKKSHKNDDFTEEEKGHILDLMQSLLREQVFRTGLTGYLMDGRIIQFFHLICKREKGAVFSVTKFEESPVMLLNAMGGQWLRALLCTTPALLEYTLPTVFGPEREELKLTKVLGTGATSVVYVSTLYGAEVVVKVFRSGCITMMNAEVENLQSLKDMNNIPKLLYLDDNAHALILSPVGIQLTCTAAQVTEVACNADLSEKKLASAALFCSLVDTVKLVHEKKIVHRDVCLSNFFAVNDSPNVLLNDFGCAVPIGNKTQFQGSLPMASCAVLEVIGEDCTTGYTPTAVDDLDMVVHSLFHRISPALCAGIIKELSPSKIGLFWKKHMAPAYWKKLLELASELDYEGMKVQIRTIIA